MAIIKLKKREELKILFAIKLPVIISELYKEIRNKKTADEINENADEIEPIFDENWEFTWVKVVNSYWEFILTKDELDEIKILKYER